MFPSQVLTELWGGGLDRVWLRRQTSCALPFSISVPLTWVQTEIRKEFDAGAKEGGARPKPASWPNGWKVCLHPELTGDISGEIKFN